MLLAAKFGAGIGDFDVQLSSTFDDALALLGGDGVGYLCGIPSVGHHQNLELLADQT